MLLDLGKRVVVTVILTGIILGGMSLSFSHMPPSNTQPVKQLNR
ncbi:protein YkpC [Bacillus sp. FSL M7-0791]